MLRVGAKPLIFATGLLWLVASYSLLSKVYYWAIHLEPLLLYLGMTTGIIFGIIKTKFIFIKLTQKNISRINSIIGKVSLWEFHLNKDKWLIVFMIGLGMILRHSFVPNALLLPLYLGIGLAMFYVALLYMKALFTK